jgi:hypothetical protein
MNFSWLGSIRTIMYVVYSPAKVKAALTYNSEVEQPEKEQ